MRLLHWCLFALALSACKAQFDKVPEASVDATRKANAQSIGDKILGAWAKDEYPPVGDEANEEFKKAHNADGAQAASDKALERDIGNFKSMTYFETVRDKDGKLEVYRFKGTFDKVSEPYEVRVVFDAQGKLAGFWVKPWKDPFA
jgi:hypothetical protein